MNTTKHTYHLNYAPHINLFTNSAGKDPLDQIRYIADLGFKTIEDSGFNAPHIPFDTSPMGIGMFGQEPSYLDKIGKTIADAGLIFELRCHSEQGEESLSTSMRQCLSDKDLRLSLKEKGLARAELFSWQKSAELIWNTLHEI